MHAKPFLVLLLGLMPALAGGASDLVLELDQTQRLIPSNVRYERLGNSVLISGEMVKPVQGRGRILGHAHVQVLTIDGQILTAIEVPLTNFQPSAKSPQRADFATRIDPLPVGAQIIRVRYDASGRTGDAGDPP
ncbi:hypothetical protein [Lamprocystis purpurea]|jgi:hypothetical protein|uniref:hypothetical protein n=1 Tax=Lamprocystis purpurea TaxID=61598 RepID=UPI00037D5259|nr:hypothetical protein [Lamprocystis purpurea]